jgi:Ca-activated chloride channel family protein
MMSAKAGPAKNVLSFYGAESTGNSFCFVLDGSGSMRGGPWEAARQELLKSIGSLKPTQRFYIIFFNKDVLAITEPGTSQPASRPLLATPENLNHAKRWLDTLQITTGEPPMKAMEVALEIECDCIYFLADGEMSDSIAKRLLEMLRKKNRAMDILDGEVVLSPIHTIAYYSDKGLDIMRKIADENRGQFSYVPKPKSPRSAK